MCTGRRCTFKVGNGQAGEGRKYSDGSSCLLLFASQCIQPHTQTMDRAGAPARYVCMSLCSLVGSETAPIPATTWGFHSVDGSSSTIPAQQHCNSTVTSCCAQCQQTKPFLQAFPCFHSPEYTTAICIPPPSVE